MTDKFMIITGGSQGIGLATAELFLEKNFKVINISRNQCRLHGVYNVQADLAQSNLEFYLGRSLSERIVNTQRIILVHNAARLDKDTVQSINVNDLRDILEINVIAPTILNKIVLPKMSKGSAIIYIGSTLSEKAVPQAYSYVTSKHAAIGLMRATCQDLINQDIHTACICPGFTDTPMLRYHLNDDMDALQKVKALNAKNRLIESQEIASTVYFAAMNPVINGTVIHANMGQKNQ